MEASAAFRCRLGAVVPTNSDRPVFGLYCVMVYRWTASVCPDRMTEIEAPGLWLFGVRCRGSRLETGRLGYVADVAVSVSLVTKEDSP